MENSETLKLWLVAILEGMVATPADIQVEVKKDEMGVLYTVMVNSGEWGFIIGKEGGNAKALRTLLSAAGRLLDIKASLKIGAPEKKQF